MKATDDIKILGIAEDAIKRLGITDPHQIIRYSYEEDKNIRKLNTLKDLIDFLFEEDK